MIIGWRVWRTYAPNSSSHLPGSGLYSLHAFTHRVWPTTTYAFQPCDGRDAQHPHLWCDCGLHAYKERSTATDYVTLHNCVWSRPHRDHSAVAGQVALGGRVVEHERGWRASHALPLSLLYNDGAEPPDGDGWLSPPQDVVAHLAALYDVPVLHLSDLQVLDREVDPITG